MSSNSMNTVREQQQRTRNRSARNNSRATRRANLRRQLHNIDSEERDNNDAEQQRIEYSYKQIRETYLGNTIVHKKL